MREQILQSIRPLDDPTARTRPPFSDFDLNRALRPRTSLKPAAVLVPLVERDAQLTVLLTQRSRRLRAHAGQISFPGGRLEAGDVSPVATALRETHEEVGIAPDYVEPVGLLDEYETRTGFHVTPVVSFVRPDFELCIDSNEVEEAFEVPLAFFLAPDNQQRQSAVRDGVSREFYVFEYQSRYIWGATAGMLMNFVRRLSGIQTQRTLPPV
ncbi:MAG: CoA pyrophosphatase [Gammaproteobacteria bacterium]|nr:CoA pyrophosphatase [Gammaproteobacteria bacterium]